MQHDLVEWASHEDHVAGLYRLLGYTVTPNISVTGQQTDLICERFTPGAGRIILYVDCKHTISAKNSISKDKINQFIANFHALKAAHGWSMGIMVSNRPYTQYARSAANAHGDIVLKTVDDLYSDLFQIHTYLHGSIQTYEAEVGVYIPPHGTKRSDERTLAPAGRQPLNTLFQQWVRSPTNTQLCILGDFGAGKTTFMHHMHYKSAKAFLAGRDRRMPLYLQLRDYHDAADGRELMERFFSLELATRVPFRLFEQFSRAGRFLLLLDGFDEMGLASSSDTRKRNYLKLAQLMSENSKLVISCRPSYFVTNDELEQVFGMYVAQMGDKPSRLLGSKRGSPDTITLTTQLIAASRAPQLTRMLSLAGQLRTLSTIVELDLFDERQIRAYLAAYRRIIATASHQQIADQSLYERIVQTYDLADLARRPILLKLIVDTLPLFRRARGGSYRLGETDEVFHDITPSVLYYVYTEGELTREYGKGHIRWNIEREARRQLIGHIAYEMFARGSIALEASAVSAITTRFLRAAGDEAEALATDVRTGSFLMRDKEGTLQFAHKSFMEYYVAQHFVLGFTTEASARRLLSERQLSEEVWYFLGDLIASFHHTAIGYLTSLTIALDEVCRTNALNLLNYARQPKQLVADTTVPVLSYLKTTPDAIAIVRSKVTRLKIVRSRFGRLGFSESSVGQLSIEASGVDDLMLNRSAVGEMSLSGSAVTVRMDTAEIGAWHMVKTRLSGGAITDSSVVIGTCADTTIHELTFTNVVFASCDAMHLRSARLNGVVFDECVFVYVDCSQGFLRQAQFNRCVFIRCTLDTSNDLDSVTECRGVFEYPEPDRVATHFVEEPGKPYILSRKKAELRVNPFYGAGAGLELSWRERAASLTKAPWEVALAVLFPARRTHDAQVSLADVREKLHAIERHGV